MNKKPIRSAAWACVAALSFASSAGAAAQSAPEAAASPQVKQTLEAIRARLKGKSFTVGYTGVADVPLKELAATVIPKELPADILAMAKLGPQLRLIDQQRYLKVEKLNPHLKEMFQSCSKTSKSFDWRRSGKVTNVKRQICGTCWDFTALGTFEASSAIRNNTLIDSSEQYILNCANAGSCDGGWWGPVFQFLITNGTSTEAADPFDGNDGKQCPLNTPTPYRASAWSFVNTADWTKPPSTAAIKESLCDHGPLATAVFVDQAFQLYNGGVFDETDQSFDWINHGIVIIGWDDNKQAWLIKNSWGTNWGETGGFGTDRGYMWIKYGSNNLGVATAWVDAARTFYKLPIDWEKLLMKAKIPLKKPIPEPDPLVIKQLDLKL
jgi:papain like protease